MSNVFVKVMREKGIKEPSPIVFKLQGCTLKECSEMLGIDITKVLELLAELKKEGRISDVQFV